VGEVFDFVELGGGGGAAESEFAADAFGGFGEGDAAFPDEFRDGEFLLGAEVLEDNRGGGVAGFLGTVRKLDGEVDFRHGGRGPDVV
jgi:hypothetical protein